MHVLNNATYYLIIASKKIYYSFHSSIYPYHLNIFNFFISYLIIFSIFSQSELFLPLLVISNSI